MRRNGVLCGLGGLAAVAFMVAFMGFGSFTVEAQVANPATAPQRPPLRADSGYAPSPQPTLLPAPPATAPAPAQPIEDRSLANTTAPGQAAERPDGPPSGQSLPPAGLTTYTTPANIVTSPSSESLKAESIDFLLNRLKSVKVQKAELERAEQELMVLLRDKIREQKQQLHTMGIVVDEPSGPGRAPYAPR